MFGVGHWLTGFQVVERTCSSPGPGAQGTPIIGLSRLTFINKPDNSTGYSCAIICLYAVGLNKHISPAVGYQLLGCRRIAASTLWRIAIPGSRLGGDGIIRRIA